MNNSIGSIKKCPFCKNEIPVTSEKCPICKRVLIERIEKTNYNKQETPAENNVPYGQDYPENKKSKNSIKNFFSSLYNFIKFKRNF